MTGIEFKYDVANGRTDEELKSLAREFLQLSIAMTCTKVPNSDFALTVNKVYVLKPLIGSECVLSFKHVPTKHGVWAHSIIDDDGEEVGFNIKGAADFMNQHFERLDGKQFT